MVKAPTEEMKHFRKQIDDIDVEIAKLLGERYSIVARVAKHKKANGIPSVLQDRIDEVVENARRLGAEYNVDQDLMETLYRAIIKRACEYEDTVIDN